ncbi:hypothetical protein Q765_12815 [Flavobacterium rivuli WB 3.3-2 = DSM 21788]|uniref:histidine kinase n=1 Tax=Flavobacterium rivuli WB 3.3-2 = DSM 21788 TaxID=1121895 RepID=A0A0A2M446_9FLAO|nr:ATP-binding protein [Flavobacterium rivuli]KGO86188.1 hypothetical protein Q765_12815 [Flavobacterium rivuli WB 3.3-2 = DSM 21788]
MKKSLLIFLITLPLYVFAQISPKKESELKRQFAKAAHDTTKINIAGQLGGSYRFSNIDSSMVYLNRALKMNDKLPNQYATFAVQKKAYLLSLRGATELEAGRLPESLQSQFEAYRIGKDLNDESIMAIALNRIGNTYMELGDYTKANDYYVQSKNLFKAVGNTGMYYNEVSNIGNIYDLLKVPDSTLYYQTLVYNAHIKNPQNRYDFTIPEIMFRMGNAYKLNGDTNKAMNFYKRGIAEANIDNDIRNLTMNNLFLAKLYNELKVPDSAMKYARNAMQSGRAVSFRKGLYDASLLLSDLYKNKGEYNNAHQYLSVAMAEKDSLMGAERFRELQKIVLNEQERQREATAKRIALQNSQRQYVLIAGICIFLIIVFILYRNNRQNKRINKKLESTLTNLKSTQSQLIQSEKMASLGELTAGIAHEIQNPLNFVNNFSDVSIELLEEMQEEIDKGDIEEANAIAVDIKQNLEKIAHHGRRADGIVKGMLQHSQSSTGQKELTDINELTDEFLRLAYHGLRAKDKTFNADLVTNFSESLPKIPVIPQDIGRVLLNLFNNAFYATQEKSKQSQFTISSYKPVIKVTTWQKDNAIMIAIKDNGNGIPNAIKDKILQPFFTTKPTGAGTGLGLSLSYDIVVKAHGGTIEIIGNEGEGAEFTISLPV